jgi:UDP-galactopyranose mutase
MLRFSKQRQVFFFEEHVLCLHHLPYLEMHSVGSGMMLLRPSLPQSWDEAKLALGVCELFDHFLAMRRNRLPPLLWFNACYCHPVAERVDNYAAIQDCPDGRANVPEAFEQIDEDLVKRFNRLLNRNDKRCDALHQTLNLTANC